VGPESRIYIAGHTGLLGSSCLRVLQEKGFGNLLTATHEQLELRDRRAVERFFQESKPEYVILAAALAGGIHRNKTFPAEMIQANLEIQCNVMGAAREAGIKRLVFIGSGCSYPKHCPMPIATDAMMTGPVEETNEPFAVAKIAGIKTCQAFNRQYGTQFISMIPATLYGPGDHFDANGHVVAALIARYHQAKVEGLESVEVWGTGKPRREFLYVDDAARAICLLLDRDKLDHDLYNVGIGQDISIADLAETISRVVGYRGRTEFDTSKPDGMPRRCLDSSPIRSLGFHAEVELGLGLEKTYKWYVEHSLELGQG
jgi:GDP-L-fucose synthase